MAVLVVGSIALDTIETPFGRVEDALGGSATYFSLAAALFGDVRLVGVVGEDFPEEYRRIFATRAIDTAGLVTRPGRTFTWTGAYKGAMNQAETLAVELNVFGDFNPDLPQGYRDSGFVFLANGLPKVQKAVLRQVPGASLVVCDTMNYYIENALDDLRDLLTEVDALVLNDQEAKMLTGVDSLVSAGRTILTMGPKFVIIKKGEHGALLVAGDGVAALPAYPTDEVKDPTGAGDSFAGGLMGCIAASGDFSFEGIKRAMGYGAAVASLTVEGFGIEALHAASRQDVEDRVNQLREMLRF